MPNLNVVICPGCGSRVPLENQGCPDCGYENNEDGRLLTIAEILERPSYPAPGAIKLSDVCPAFIRAIVAAATATSAEDSWQVIGVSGRVLYEGSMDQCDAWVAAGNVGGSYSIERKPG